MSKRINRMFQLVNEGVILAIFGFRAQKRLHKNNRRRHRGSGRRSRDCFKSDVGERMVKCDLSKDYENVGDEEEDSFSEVYQLAQVGWEETRGYTLDFKT